MEHANGEHVHAHMLGNVRVGRVVHRYRVIALYFDRDHNAKQKFADDRDERDHDDHKLIVLLLNPHQQYCN